MSEQEFSSQVQWLLLTEAGWIPKESQGSQYFTGTFGLEMRPEGDERPRFRLRLDPDDGHR